MWKNRERKASRKPGVRRISFLALSVLEEAASRAEHGPIERTGGHRLALAWLAYMEFAQPHQADQFWTMLARSGSYQMDEGGHFRFRADSAWMLKGWKERAL